MALRPLDAAFAQFQGTGDPEALAEVFDATAAELLRVASHLVVDPHAAEDLVQSTFLAAIESASRYNPRQPVMPWLVGILTNQARQHRQAVSRRPDPARVDPTGLDDVGQ